MKRIFTLLMVITVLTAGCGSSKKQLERGNWDEAIEKAVAKLRKDRGDAKQASILEDAYRIANEQDNERIRYLKTEAKAANQDEIYLTYQRLAGRQTLVRTVLPLRVGGNTIDYPYVDYMQPMADAKRSAADFYFSHARDLMKTGTKEACRQAYNEFMRAKQYAGDYPGIDSGISEARYLGISRVLLNLKNSTIFNFPDEFKKDLLSLSLNTLNSDWVEYHITDPGKEVSFDYLISINVRNIAVSPDQSAQHDSVVKKEVEDGFTYLLDKNGNVSKDSLGNDIKIKKYKTLQCALVETIQSKTCVINGDVEVVRLANDQVLKKDPLGAQSTFEWISSRAIGDVNALNQEQLNRTKSKPAPFPSDMEMIMRCSENLKAAIRASVQNNRRLIY